MQKTTEATLVNRYMNLKRGLRTNTLRAYQSGINRIHTDPFGQKQIKNVKLSDGKTWFVALHDEGLKMTKARYLSTGRYRAFSCDQVRQNA